MRFGSRTIIAMMFIICAGRMSSPASGQTVPPVPRSRQSPNTQSPSTQSPSTQSPSTRSPSTRSPNAQPRNTQPRSVQPPGLLPPDRSRTPRQLPQPTKPNPNAGERTPFSADEPDYIIRSPDPLNVRDYSWTYIDPPPPRLIRLHDIITITVDEKSEVTLRSGFDRQRTTNLEAELEEFIRFDDDGNLANAAENEPTIDGNINERMRTLGRVTDQEGIRYRIAATVVNVLPNGVVVLEARKSIRTDRDLWQFTLTGKIRSEDINRDNTALSENIADLQIVKKRAGKVHESTKRRWGTRLFDMLWPF